MRRPNRKEVLLRAAFDLLRRADNSPIVLETLSTLVHYDDANCDGSCLMEDIASELGIDPKSEPVPLKFEKGEEE